MLQAQRHNEIMKILKDRKSASVAYIAKTIFASEATVRRDLAEMAKLGLIRRTHGGAITFEGSNDETSALVRMTVNIPQKERIATLALPLLSEGRTMFFDASSTVGVLCKRFDLKYKTVITNGLHSALALAEKESLNVIIPGGSLFYNSNSVIGSMTLSQLQSFNPDIAVMSCGGIANGFVSEATMESAEIKKAVLTRSKVKILLITSEKFGQVLPFNTARIDDFDYVITDSRPPYSEMERAEKAKFVF